MREDQIDRVVGDLLAKICSHSSVNEAMQDAWNDICTDTGCHPLDIMHGIGRDLVFRPDHWANQIAKRLFVRALKLRLEVLPGPAQQPVSTITDEMVEAAAKVVHPLAFEIDEFGDYLIMPIGRREAKRRAREILSAALSPIPSTEQPPHSETRAALKRLHLAVRALGRIGENNVTLFEDSPIKSQEAYEAWTELNGAQGDAAKALGFKLLFDNEWLKAKIASDPDVDCEAGTAAMVPSKLHSGEK